MHSILFGNGLDYSEVDIWWVLNKRKRLRTDKHITIHNKIHYYGDVSDEKKSIMDSFDICVHQFEKPNSHNGAFVYGKMIGEIKSNIKNN